MNKSQKYLIDNNLGDIVLNAKEFPENTLENAKKWIYLSDVLEQYLALNQGQSLPIDNVSKAKRTFCNNCKSGLIDYPEINRRTCRCGSLGYNVTE